MPEDHSMTPSYVHKCIARNGKKTAAIYNSQQPLHRPSREASSTEAAKESNDHSSPANWGAKSESRLKAQNSSPVVRNAQTPKNIINRLTSQAAMPRVHSSAIPRRECDPADREANTDTAGLRLRAFGYWRQETSRAQARETKRGIVSKSCFAHGVFRDGRTACLSGRLPLHHPDLPVSCLSLPFSFEVPSSSYR